MYLRGVAQLGRVCRVGHTILFIDLRGVAQLVARLVRDQEVRGSSPRTPILLGGNVDVGVRFILRLRERLGLRLPRDPGPVRPVQNVCHWHTGPRTPIFLAAA